ncbi:amidase [Altererythrobacter sp. B11]|uniref:amidase n=1 Tax=Altererythrobacter sp. B11 TaxID=2060312 RepID=UPI00155910AF|nr:amidase family protein [Altererythrobacter sp. B11]
MGQAQAIRNGEFTSAELCKAAQLRIEEGNPALNAVTWLAEEPPAPANETGTLAGVPWLLKASLEYPGWPFTSCSRSRMHAVGRKAWPFTQACLDAGLVPIGFTGMPEFGLLTTGEPLATGPVHNPAAPGRSAGGSSSGAAAAVAAGFAPLAHASDAAGSIRIPAANCGVIGLKPSRGGNLRARAPHLIDDVLCSDMLIARSMRDIAASYDIVAAGGGETATRSLRGLRVGFALTGLDGRQAAPAVVEKLRAAARDLEQAGAVIEEVAIPGDHAAMIRAFKAIWMQEGGELTDLITAANPSVAPDELLEPWTLGLAKARETLDAGETANAFRQLALSEFASAEFFARYDVLLSPVAQEPPIALGRHAPDRAFAELWEDFWPFVNFTPHANIAGLPSITLPFWGGAEDGPVGVMMTMKAGADCALIALSRELEGR